MKSKYEIGQEITHEGEKIVIKSIRKDFSKQIILLKLENGLEVLESDVKEEKPKPRRTKKVKAAIGETETKLLRIKDAIVTAKGSKNYSKGLFKDLTEAMTEAKDFNEMLVAMSEADVDSLIEEIENKVK